jgi:hypothetical protein
MATAKKVPMRKAATSQLTRDDVQVVLADLFRHVGMRQTNPENAPKLPTRLRKLEGIDDLPPHVAAALGPAAGLWADLVLGAIDRAGYAIVEK